MPTSQTVTVKVTDKTGTAERKVTVAAGTSDADAAKAAGIPAGAKAEVVDRVDVVDDAKTRARLQAEEATRTDRAAKARTAQAEQAGARTSVKAETDVDADEL